MKCPICGKQTLPGAKLCSPCRAALKRAKDDSVWELPPSQRQGEPEPAPAREAQWVLGAPRLAGWRMWTLAAAALAVCVGVGVQFARSGERVPVATVAATMPASRPAVTEAPAVPLPPALTASTPVAGARAAVPAADPDLVQPPRQADHPPPARPKPAITRTLEPQAPPVVSPADAPAPVPVPVAVPTVEPPARNVDPWQRLNDALARCRGQDLFARLGCEYRARATHCEGHWGETPQCAAQTSNDHGQ